MKRLSKEPTIHEPARISNCTFGTFTEIGEFSYLENTVMEDYSYSGQFCIFQNVLVRRFSNIAAFVRIGPTMHPVERPTLHHFTYRRIMYGFAETDDEEFFESRKSRRATIGNDTRIGHGAVIMPGVSIGDGAIVGAGAVVTKDVPPYMVAAGVPARPVKRRFPEKLAERLAAIEWWNWSHDVIRERLPDFLGNVEEFVEKYCTEAI